MASQSNASQSSSDFDNLLEPEEEVDEPPPPDPVDIAARLLLARALAAAGTTSESAGQNGSVCIVELSATEWGEPIRSAWQHLVRRGESPLSSAFELHRGKPGWVAWVPDPGSRWNRRDPDMVALALSVGCHCVAIAANTSDIPEDLCDAADYRITVPPLASADIVELVRTLCGRVAAEVLSEEEAAQLTPRLLRLARRPGQSADAYVQKLRAVLARVRAKTASSVQAPRDAPTLDRLHGMTEAVAWGQRLARNINEYRAGRIAWSEVDRGLLLSGPPGCGKTLFARALAATCNVPLFTGSYGQWLGTGGGHQGSLLLAMRGLFAKAKKAAPAILFIDELDSFPDRTTVHHQYAEWDVQVVNALLAEIDGVEDRVGVVLIAACNHPWKLDPALVRSGRLDRHIRIGLPDMEALTLILREHLGGDLAEENLSRIALLALGSTGADCEHAVRGARQRARLAKRPMIFADLAAEFSGDNDGTPDNLRVAAVHEAGHAVAEALLRSGSVRVVSLRSRRGTGGATVSSLPGPYQTFAEIQARLTTFLGGRAAEEALLGSASTGAGGERDSDLACATALAASAVGSYGLVSDAGSVWLTSEHPEEALRLVRENAWLARQVRTLLDTAHGRALELVQRHRVAVETVVEALLDKRILTGAEVETLVRLAAPPPPAADDLDDILSPSHH